MADNYVVGMTTCSYTYFYVARPFGRPSLTYAGLKSVIPLCVDVRDISIWNLFWISIVNDIVWLRHGMDGNNSHNMGFSFVLGGGGGGGGQGVEVVGMGWVVRWCKESVHRSTSQQCIAAFMIHFIVILKSSPPRQNDCHFADDIFKCSFVNEKFCIWSNFQWNLFVRVQLIITQQWFRWWLGAE